MRPYCVGSKASLSPHDSREDDSATIRIVRRAIDGIRNAIVVAVAAIPMTAIQFPAIAVLPPLRRNIVIAVAFAFPVTAAPDMATFSQVPVSRRPSVATAGAGTASYRGGGGAVLK